MENQEKKESILNYENPNFATYLILPPLMAVVTFFSAAGGLNWIPVIAVTIALILISIYSFRLATSYIWNIKNIVATIILVPYYAVVWWWLLTPANDGLNVFEQTLKLLETHVF